MYTLQNTYDDFKAYKKDISDVDTALFVRWCNYVVSFCWERIIHTSPDKLRCEYNVTLQGPSSGYQKIALPANFDMMNSWGTGVFLLDDQGRMGATLTYNNVGDNSLGYYLEPGYLVITGGPSQPQAAVVRYTPTVPVFSSLADYWTLDKTGTGTALFSYGDFEFLTRAIDVQYTMWDEDIAMEPVADQRFVRILSDMLQRQRSSVNVYNINSFSSAF